MRLCTHVVKNKLGMYYARVYVPKDLRELVEKAEIRRTLKTTCYATAVERARPVVRAVRGWFDDLRREYFMSTHYTKLTRIGSIETSHADGSKQTMRDIEVDGEKEVEVVSNLVAGGGSIVNVGTDNPEVAQVLKSSQQAVPTPSFRNGVSRTASSLNKSGAKLISEALEDFIVSFSVQ